MTHCWFSTSAVEVDGLVETLQWISVVPMHLLNHAEIQTLADETNCH